MPKMQTQPVDDDGWSTVTRAKGRVPEKNQQKLLPDKNLSLEKLQADYNRRMRTWQASTCRKELQQILNRKQPDDGWQIKEAICLASGSFSRDNWECQKRTMCQFVAFMDTVKHLQATSDDKVTIVAQEMVYTPLDIEFLLGMDMTVYNDPVTNEDLYNGTSAPDHLSPASFVFEAFMDKHPPTVQQVLTSGMRLFIGTWIAGGSARYTTSDADVRKCLVNEVGFPEHLHSSALIENERRVLKMCQECQPAYSSYHFPRFEEDSNVFEGLKIFWREPKDEDDDG